MQGIRQGYLGTLQSLSSMSSSVLNVELGKLRNFLNQTGNRVFSAYLNAPFCEISSSFKSRLENLFPDFHNFTVLISLWNNFVGLKEFTEESIEREKRNWAALTG